VCDGAKIDSMEDPSKQLEILRIKRLIDDKKRELEIQNRDLEERRLREDRIRMLILEKEIELNTIKLKEQAASEKQNGKK